MGPDTLRAAEKLRGLTLKEKPACELQSAQGMRERLLLEFQNEATLKSLSMREKFFENLGIIPQGFDYLTHQSRAVGEGFYGAYSPSESLLFLSNEQALPEKFLLHEAIHVLQDQHFDLEGFLASNSSFDLSLVRLALVEGEAEFFARGLDSKCLAIDEQLPELEQREFSSVHRQTPRALRLFDAFHGIFGLHYVCRRYADGGIAALDELFKNPPSTSAELMFETPMTPIGEKESLGAFGVFALLSTYFSMIESWEVVSSFVRDSVDNQQSAFKWQSEWSNEASAKEFFERLKLAYSIRFQMEPKSSVEKAKFANTSIGTLVVLQANNSVTVQVF